MRGRWLTISWPYGAETGRQWPTRRAPMRSSSAGTAAWRRCSPASIRRRLNAGPRNGSALDPRLRSPPDRPMDAPYAKLEQLEPGIARVLAHNPSAFTYYGTQTYLIGEKEVAVVDPGPDLPEHVGALEEAIGGRPVSAIMC